LHFLGLTFMCQNKYLAAMQRNNYTVMLMHWAVHGAVSAFIYITDWAKGPDCNCKM
jgi:hypothetical protein